MELLQFVKDYWAILGSIVSLLAYLTVQIMALRNGIKALLHDRIIQKCEYHIKNNHINADDLGELEYLNKPYKALGGNGTVEVMLRAVHKLPKQVQEEN